MGKYATVSSEPRTLLATDKPLSVERPITLEIKYRIGESTETINNVVTWFYQHQAVSGMLGSGALFQRTNVQSVTTRAEPGKPLFVKFKNGEVAEVESVASWGLENGELSIRQSDGTRVRMINVDWVSRDKPVETVETEVDGVLPAMNRRKRFDPLTVYFRDGGIDIVDNVRTWKLEAHHLQVYFHGFPSPGDINNVDRVSRGFPKTVTLTVFYKGVYGPNPEVIENVAVWQKDGDEIKGMTFDGDELKRFDRAGVRAAVANAQRIGGAGQEDSQLRTRIDELERTLTGIQARSNGLQQQNANLEKDLEGAKGTVHEREAKIIELRGRVDALKAQLDERDETLKRYLGNGTRLGGVQVDGKTLWLLPEVLRAIRQGAHDHIDALRKELADAKTENARLAKQFTGLEIPSPSNPLGQTSWVTVSRPDFEAAVKARDELVTVKQELLIARQQRENAFKSTSDLAAAYRDLVMIQTPVAIIKPFDDKVAAALRTAGYGRPVTGGLVGAGDGGTGVGPGPDRGAGGGGRASQMYGFDKAREGADRTVTIPITGDNMGRVTDDTIILGLGQDRIPGGAVGQPWREGDSLEAPDLYAQVAEKLYGSTSEAAQAAMNREAAKRQVLAEGYGQIVAQSDEAAQGEHAGEDFSEARIEESVTVTGTGGSMVSIASMPGRIIGVSPDGSTTEYLDGKVIAKYPSREAYEAKRAAEIPHVQV